MNDEGCVCRFVTSVHAAIVSINLKSLKLVKPLGHLISKCYFKTYVCNNEKSCIMIITVSENIKCMKNKLILTTPVILVS